MKKGDKTFVVLLMLLLGSTLVEERGSMETFCGIAGLSSTLGEEIFVVHVVLLIGSTLVEEKGGKTFVAHVKKGG